MAEANPTPGVKYDYTLEQAKVVYALVEKPADMSDHEWAIVSDEGFRKYLASQFGVKYESREEMRNRAK
ncbi:MAG TPA: hypothetical protein VE988_25425 [Gemmataceae bacterium]|nr:hypothetical protein [Gemmataceae bacterium]